MTTPSQVDKSRVPVRYTDTHDIEVSLTVAYVQQRFCKEATAAEAYAFIRWCLAHRINPEIGEAFLIKRGEKFPALPQPSYRFWLQLAAAQPDYRGLQYGVILLAEDGLLSRPGCMYLPTEHLVGGWAQIDRAALEPMRAEVARHEYDTGNGPWSRMPGFMCAKTAIGQVSRFAYPNAFRGMHLPEGDGADSGR